MKPFGSGAPRRTAAQIKQRLLSLLPEMRCEWLLQQYESIDRDMAVIADMPGGIDRQFSAVADMRESQYELIKQAGQTAAQNVADVRRKTEMLRRHQIGNRSPGTYDAADELVLAMQRDLEKLQGN